MYYIKLSDSDNNKLNYYCRNCGNIDENISSENLHITKQNFNNNSQKIDLFVNQYTKLDPTLPRTNAIKCPNDKCITNMDMGSEVDVKNSEKNINEILYIRYDDINMKYIYVCCKCDFIWKTNIK